MIKIGLTFDLKEDYLKRGFSNDEVAEFDTLETIDALDLALTSLKFELVRIGNIFDLVEFLSSGNRCDLIFNICEGMFGIAREAQVPCLLDAYQIPYVFSGPEVLNLALDKGLTKLLLKYSGILTTDFKVISQWDDLIPINLPFPLFVKPIAEGTSKGIDEFSLAGNPDQLEKSVNYLINTYHQPVLVEPFLPGREFTVGIIGSEDDAKALGTLEIILNRDAPHSFYSNTIKKDWEKFVSYKISTDTVALKCADIAVKAWKIIKGLDAGRIDFRLDANGNPNLIEVNPLAGLNPSYSDLPILARLNGITYNQLIAMIVNSALKRILP